ncbi:MAG: transglutaminase domain-containing protein [Anaerolineae bacterium]
MNNLLEYYATPGPMTDPGPHAVLFDGLPTEIPALVEAIQGFMFHIFWAEAYGLEVTEERKEELELRRVDLQLARLLELDDRPLTEARPYEQKLVSNCRDFSVMMTAILRHKGIPARARCGFGTYFLPGHFEDHWTCEVWNAEEERWTLVDAQLDELMLEELPVDFDPLDVPRDRFIVGGQAWQWCRSGKEDPEKFGIFDMHGLDFVAGDLIRDFLAFNKLEILPWDGGWGYLTEEEKSEEELATIYAVLDRIADLTLTGDNAVTEMHALYESDPGFHVPAEVRRTSAL